MLQVTSNSKYEVDIVSAGTPGDGGRWPSIPGKDDSGVPFEPIMVMD